MLQQLPHNERSVNVPLVRNKPCSLKMTLMDICNTWSAVGLTGNISLINNLRKILDHDIHFKDRNAILNFLYIWLNKLKIIISITINFIFFLI